MFIYFYLFLTALGVSCSTRDLSLRRTGFSLFVVRGLSCPMECGILVPQSGIEPTSLALEGRFLTTGPRGKSHYWHFEVHLSKLTLCTPARPHRHIQVKLPISIALLWRSCRVFHRKDAAGSLSSPPSLAARSSRRPWQDFNKLLMSSIKASKDGLRIWTIYALKNSIFRAAGSEFTCRWARWAGHPAGSQASWFYSWVLDLPLPLSWWASPFVSLSLICSWIYVKLGVTYDYAEYEVLCTYTLSTRY